MFNTNSYNMPASPSSNNHHHNELLQSSVNNGNGSGGGIGIDTECSSPMSMGSVTSLNSNRSHDGVFLRPGAVSRYVYKLTIKFYTPLNKLAYSFQTLCLYTYGLGLFHEYTRVVHNFPKNSIIYYRNGIVFVVSVCVYLWRRRSCITIRTHIMFEDIIN